MNSSHGVQNTPSLQFVRMAGNMLMNLLLLPVYVALLVVCFCIALTPLFPARTARENLKARLELSPIDRIFATTATLFHYVLVVIEDFIFFPLGLLTTHDPLQSFDEIQSSAAAALKNSTGLVVLSAHFGNIEVSAHCIQTRLKQTQHFDQRLFALAKPSRWAFATRILSWYRTKRGIDVLWTNRKDLVKAMMLALKSRNALALLVDQKPASGGHFINFFGAASAFPDGGIEVALRVNAEFIFFTSRRIWPGHYTYEAEHFRRSLESPPSAAEILASYVRWLEAVIRKSPWQWCWDYRKWSRQPKHERLA